jgi:hypothetical protein
MRREKREYKKRPLFRTASELKDLRVCNADLWRFSNSNYNQTSGRFSEDGLGLFECAEQIHAYFLCGARDV